ncbi:MAG: multiheme c-type cytochrome [Planctomycetota bacterium]|nr:multiheme c-type cytochrome [Planctomycetota bacterium]
MNQIWTRAILSLIFGSVSPLSVAPLSVAWAQSHSIHRANPDFFVKRDCNSSNCHGNTVDDALLWNQSGEIWFQHDPHANAYARLLNADSLRIVQALWDQGKSFPETTEDPAYLEFLETRCVACHASELAPKTQRIQGVDCQACHGSAIHWDDSHFSSSWKALGARRFYDHHSAEGRVNTESAWQLAQVCGSCHIGQLGRTDEVQFNNQSSMPLGQQEVSHQLMAAGHPPTYFELSNFLTRYPKHWWDSNNVAAPTAKPDVGPTITINPVAESLDTWRIGKLVNAKQRLELLKNRLGKPEWPELTEHRCTSCHHPIDATRKTIAPASQPYAEWDGWYLEHIDLALAITQFPSAFLPCGPMAITPIPFLHPSVQSWALHHSTLKQLLLNPVANHPTGQTAEIRTHIDALLEILEPIIHCQYPIVTPDQIPTIQKAWNAKLSLSVAQGHSWESAVQWTLAYQALGEKEIPGRISLRPKTQDWDFPTTMWTRTQQMPYQASRFFDPEDFQKQLLDIIDSLKR